MASEVIMPALGMAQDSGVIVVWHKTEGDAVSRGDVLFEVETDKAVMEVAAQADGVLIERRAGEGADVPVGQVIAVIGGPADTVTAPPAAIRAETTVIEPGPEPAPEPVTAPAPALSGTSRPNDRILASPKARRLAREKGLGLARLVQAGHRQPFHAADVEAFAAISAIGGAAALTARARVPAARFDQLSALLSSETGAPAIAALAAFGAGAYRAATDAETLCIIATAPLAPDVAYIDPDRAGLAELEPSETLLVPDLIVYDLTATRLVEAGLAAARAPTLTVGRDGDHLVATLVAGNLDGEQLIVCLDAFAGRIEQPLRHLL